ncbi:MAG: cation:proton antiporter [Aquisalinus sp.]|nr:cation:proton antiporter [Aquisalinus sp.]
MGSEVWAIVFGLAGILLLAVLMLPVASRTRIPHTVILALLGIALGLLIHYLGGVADAAAHGAGHAGGHAGGAAGDSGHGSEPFWLQMLNAIGSLEITADVILFVFLPALVFESALSLNVRKLMADIGPILFLAAIGVLISTFVIGQAINWYTGQGLLLCLLLGAVVSATDPVAVIALFKDLGAPKRLTILVEGESLFNDATAIVVSSILLSILVMPGDTGWLDGLLQFFVVFFGGIVVGLVLTWIAAQIMKPFRRQPMVIVTITVILPFILFVVAEHFMHISGVMACVASGLLLGSVGRRIIPPQSFEEIEHTWHQIAFWATSLIFVLVGLAVPQLLGGNLLSYADEILFLFVVATAIRAAIIFGLVPVLSTVGLAQKVSGAFRTIMVWGGLRGAVSLALALIILETPNVSEEAKAFIGVMVTSFVLITLLGQATTISPLLAFLGLNKLEPTDQAVRDRSLIKALSDVKSQLDEFVQGSSVIEPAKLTSVTDVYSEALEKAEIGANGDSKLSDTDWQLIGLEMAIAQERQMYLQKFGEGLLSSGRLRETLASLESVTESLSDITRNNSHKAADIAIQQGVEYAPNFKTAMDLQRRLGLTGPLAKSLEKRFGILALKKDVLQEQRHTRLPEITGLLPKDAQAGFIDIMDQRIALVEEHHKALCLQYPDYAEALERANLEQIGLRLEEIAYNKLKSNSIIGPEIHNDLMRELAARQASASRLPTLKLDQNPAHLIAKVPFFAELPESKQQQIARMLKTRFTVPGENIINAGEVGDKMYFIASGAVRIHVQDDLTLGTGDFFGELALITDQPRNADVSALGFSTLLELHKRDFHTLLKKDSSVKQHIQAVAIERLGPDFRFELAI